VLTSHGLEVALESLAASAPVPVGVDIELDERLPRGTEVAAYYLICGAQLLPPAALVRPARTTAARPPRTRRALAS
jgi:hypothetical protein